MLEVFIKNPIEIYYAYYKTPSSEEFDDPNFSIDDNFEIKHSEWIPGRLHYRRMYVGTKRVNTVNDLEGASKVTLTFGSEHLEAVGITVVPISLSDLTIRDPEEKQHAEIRFGEDGFKIPTFEVVDICPATKCECKWFAVQRDGNGDVNLTHCSHPENPDENEGNTTRTLCPLCL